MRIVIVVYNGGIVEENNCHGWFEEDCCNGLRDCREQSLLDDKSFVEVHCG